MPDRHGEFFWYELITPDPDGAKAFYDAVVVGWDVEPQPTGDLDYRMIRTSSGNAGGVMRMGEDMVARGAKPVWLGYIGVADVGRSVADIERLGGNVLMPAFDVRDVGRIALVADPQGNAFYIMRGASDEPGDVYSTTAEGRVGWNELTTPEPAAARGFYAELFGWTSDEFMPMGELGEYRFLARNGTTFGAICGVMPGSRQGWRYYIRVPSISTSAEAVKSGGGAVALGPHEVPGGDFIIIGKDPQGAEFALVGKL